MGLSQQQYAEYRTWSLPYVTDTLISIFFFLLPVFLSVYELSGAFIIVLSALLRLKRTDPKPIALVLSLLKMQLDFMIYPPPNSTGVFFIGVYRCTTGGGVRGVYQYRFAGWFGYRFIANRIPFHRKSDTVSSQKGVVRIPFHRKSDTVSSQIGYRFIANRIPFHRKKGWFGYRFIANRIPFLRKKGSYCTTGGCQIKHFS
jgi:hypothetical protein